MIPIGGDRQAVLLKPQLLPPKLASGGQVQALVLGSNRRGLSVQIGQETFQLNVASSLANAKTLTLQGAGSSGASQDSGVQVKIVAADDRPLPRAVLAELATVQKPSPPAVSTIVQTTNWLDVPAQPLNADRQAVGATVTLRLQALPNESSPSSPAKRVRRRRIGCEAIYAYQWLCFDCARSAASDDNKGAAAGQGVSFASAVI